VNKSILKLLQFGGHPKQVQRNFADEHIPYASTAPIWLIFSALN
jgi:hypothetical protein